MNGITCVTTITCIIHGGHDNIQNHCPAVRPFEAGAEHASQTETIVESWE